VACLSATPFAHAADAKLHVIIDVSYKNVPVATLMKTVNLTGNAYAIAGRVKSSKLVSSLRKSKGNFSSQGIISGRKIVPTVQKLNYRSGKKRSNSTMTFAKGNVVDMTAKPAIKYKKNSVAVTAAHLKNVLDPVSTLLFPIAEGAQPSGTSVCNRTIQVFDGKNRMQLKFSYKGETTGRAKGFSGQVYTCSVRYTPVAGHRLTSKSTKFMQTQRDISVQMAQIGETNMFGLFGFYVPTRYGVARGTASSFQTR